MDLLICITLKSKLLNTLQAPKRKVVIFAYSSQAINSSAIQFSMCRITLQILVFFFFYFFFFSAIIEKH